MAYIKGFPILTDLALSWYNIYDRGRPGESRKWLWRMAMDLESTYLLVRRRFARFIAGVLGITAGFLMLMLVVFVWSWLGLELNERGHPLMLVLLFPMYYVWKLLQWVATRVTPYPIDEFLRESRPTLFGWASLFVRDALAILRAGRSRRR